VQSPALPVYRAQDPFTFQRRDKFMRNLFRLGVRRFDSLSVKIELYPILDVPEEDV
jgi:hypothetical protein